MSTLLESAAQFTSAEAARTAILAGNATFTLVSKKTGARFTYKVQAREGRDGQPVHFVKLLAGPDNTADFVYLGMVHGRGVRPTAASKVGADAPSMRALDWTLAQLAAGRLPETVEVWHTGRCCRCGRLLTVPESVASGIGPDCAGKL